MMMTGCISDVASIEVDSSGVEHDIADNRPTDTVPKVSTANTMFTAELLLLDASNPGIMKVNVYKDGTTVTIMTTGDSETTKVGVWEFCERFGDREIFNLTTDNIDIVMVVEKGGHAVLHAEGSDMIYGIWERPGEQIKEGSTAEKVKEAIEGARPTNPLKK